MKLQMRAESSRPAAICVVDVFGRLGDLMRGLRCIAMRARACLLIATLARFYAGRTSLFIGFISVTLACLSTTAIAATVPVGYGVVSYPTDFFSTANEACDGAYGRMAAIQHATAPPGWWIILPSWPMTGPGVCQWPTANTLGGPYGSVEFRCPTSGGWGFNGSACVRPDEAEGCPLNTTWVPQIGACRPVVDQAPPDTPRKSCGDGNPIFPMLGAKSQSEDTGVRLSGLALVLTYDSTLKVPMGLGSPPASARAGVLGELWHSNFHRRLLVQAGGQSLLALRGDGHTEVFASDGLGQFISQVDSRDRIIASSTGYRYVDADTRTVETYDTQGVLLQIGGATGTRLSFAYSDASTSALLAPAPGFLLQTSDERGRIIEFRYNSAGRVVRIIDPAGQGHQLAYDTPGNLSSLTRPDGTAKTFLYENSAFNWALTGILDERSVRFATFGYDSAGRATSTEHAGGVQRYAASYTSRPRIVVTEQFDSNRQLVVRSHQWTLPEGLLVETPEGSSVARTSTLINGKPYLTSQSQPAGAGCAASSSTLTYDVNGNVASRDDFNGTRSCTAYDLSRNLATSRTEGLVLSQACSAVMVSNASLPAGARKTSTQWHPDWNLETKVAAPGRITTSVYNGQPDPFNGNAIASCAPTIALLPDGKPIAVLCKKVEQSTTDADGHLGFSAALQGGVTNRVSTWTYNQYGQVLTAKGPRTAVNDTTTYAYYADTTADHTVGDLKTVTNAAGKLTTYDKYNKLGQLLQSTDANGNVTVNTYDARQRLLTSSVAGETTTYAYDPVGQLAQVTQADGSWVGYEYDDAHRQKAVKDNLGNRIEYQLDNTGSKTGESAKDPTGSLKRSLARVMDALGRIQQNTGRE